MRVKQESMPEFSEGSPRRHSLSRISVFSVVSLLLVVALALLAGCGSDRLVASLFIPDANNNRVLIYSAPFTNGMNAATVLGQTDFVSSNAGLSQTAMNYPYATAVDGEGNLYVSDLSNCRVLQFRPPFTNGKSATLAFGEPDLATANCYTGLSANASSLGSANGVAVDSHGNLWVADSANSRILEYTPPFVTGQAAVVAIGQPTTNGVSDTDSCNQGNSSGGGAAVNFLCYPTHLAFDAAGNLWVADTGNNRILQFQPPFTTDMDASLELGQPAGATQFTSNTPNNPVLQASSVYLPTGVAFDGAGNLLVADTGNSRVLQFKPPFSNGGNASFVLGQSDFSGGSVNQGLSAPTAATLYYPAGVTLDYAGRIVVGDTGNNRTLIFTAPAANGTNAMAVLGQPDFVSNADNQGLGAPTAATQSAPFGLPSWVTLLVFAGLVAVWVVRRRNRLATARQ